MRYYYTCPIKAAYMAKEFGFKFTHEPDGNEKDVCALLAAGCFTWIESISYVHPDCHDMLKPEVDDVVTFGLKKDIKKGVYEVKFDLYADLEEFDEWEVIEIIQRNGKVWFTPEVEDEV